MCAVESIYLECQMQGFVENESKHERQPVNSISQGSHSDWKTWKTWKNGKAFSSQGKVREF